MRISFILFICAAKNLEITYELSRFNIQSRFISNFTRIMRLIDTPQSSIQGFVVDLSCNNFEKIFTNVCGRSTCGNIYRNANMTII